MFRPLHRPSYANVMSTGAVFLALGGTGYAAVTLPSNSVGTRQLRSSAVTRQKLAKSAVDSSKVRDGSLTGADIALATLGKVPAAQTADSAPISLIQRVSVAGTSDPNSGPGFTLKTVTALCPAGLFVVGGGASVSDETSQFVNDSAPSGASAWTATVANGGGGSPGFTVTAVCAAAASAN